MAGENTARLTTAPPKPTDRPTSSPLSEVSTEESRLSGRGPTQEPKRGSTKPDPSSASGMPVIENFTLALQGLSANKMRAALTMLGIIIGVGAVITMVALGEGAREKTLAQIKALG